MEENLNKCDRCGKNFSNRSNLKAHLKKTKSCGVESKVTYDCSYCDKKFTSKKNLEYHLGNSCEQKKDEEKKTELKIIEDLKEKNRAMTEQLKNNEKKFDDQDRYYDKLIVNETISKEKLKNEIRIHKEQIAKLEKTIEDLHIKIEKLVASKSASTVNNIVNNGNVINLNTFITPEFVKDQATQYLTYDHFANGIKGIVNFVHDFVLMDKSGKLVYACYDKSRHILRYKDDEGNEIDDIDAEKLIGIVDRPIKEKYFKICKNLKEDLERYQRIIDDDDECASMKKDAREKKEKCEKCLRVMEFQSTTVSTIGMSKNKEFSRAIEKKCLVPKVGRLPPPKNVTVVEVNDVVQKKAEIKTPPSSQLEETQVEETVEDEKKISEEVEEQQALERSLRLKEKLEKLREDQAKEKAREQAEAAKFTPYKLKGYILHKETSFVFDRDKKVVGKSIKDDEDGGEMFAELEEGDVEICKRFNFEIGEDL